MNNYKFIRRHYHVSPKAGVIYCESSYELKAALMLDEDDNVIFYETQIPFVSNKGNKRKIDFLVTYANGSKSIIEIKPIRRLVQFAEQISDNEEYASSNGFGFICWTEQDLGFAKEDDARKWIDQYLGDQNNIDYSAHRKQRSSLRTQRHYRKKIASNKIKFFCEYCKEEHEQLQLTYDKNIAKNGRFICIRENGHLVGKKSKPKKENPYEDEGKKQCTGKNSCGKILLLESFSKGKSVCKECRAKAYTRRYNAKKGI